MSGSTGGAEERYEDFAVAGWVNALGGSIARHPKFWIRLGNVETRAVAEALADVRIEAPLYVTGLARAGTTILLEALARHDDVATHRYKDYPPVFTPYWWNRFLERVPQKSQPAVERSHRDGILVTPDSPEAFEEMLWMAFFRDLHDPQRSQVLDGTAGNPAFEKFYTEHLRKLLRIRGGRRYLAKGNYNLTRLEYLLKLFPDARFVVAVRDPVRHVASLAKQHDLLCRAERTHPRALAYMRRVGHFEFGLDRRPINAGDSPRTAAVTGCWAEGREIEGWARYWASLYDYVSERLAADARLREAVLVVRYEDLCAAPRDTLQAVFAHCRLDAAEKTIAETAARIRAPDYYRPDFDAQELAVIAEHTDAAARRFGYGGSAQDATFRDGR